MKQSLVTPTGTHDRTLRAWNAGEATARPAGTPNPPLQY